MKKAFTLVEILVYIAVLAVVFLIVGSFVFWLVNSESKAKANRELLINAKRAIDTISYQIREAESIYDPTTTANQLSLEIKKYLPEGEETSFIDFFLCGTQLCLKKESQEPLALTSDNVEISNLIFTKVVSGGAPSVKIDLTVEYKNQTSISLTSTASLRSY